MEGYSHNQYWDVLKALAKGTLSPIAVLFLFYRQSGAFLMRWRMSMESMKFLKKEEHESKRR